jgi:hypothetical protein
MITTKITIKPHLHEYCIAKYAGYDPAVPIRFPMYTDLYVLVWDRLRKRPVDHPVDTGNMEIVLPKCREGKNPRDYNFISRAGQRDVEHKIEQIMWADFHEYVENEHYRNSVSCIESINSFIDLYGINSLSEDAFRKNYYRWRKKMRNHRKITST